MFAETSEKKSNVRVAFALVCALAVCCSVMYITADAGDEYMHEVVKGHDAGTSVDTTDTIKAGQIYTETPDGRMRLMDYFNNVEKEISDEVANRRSDIASVRAQMARDFAFNAAARNTLKKEMLHKMSVNAKIARDHLNRAMYRTQRKFARTAALANRRHKRNLKRHAKTMRLIKRDRDRAAKRLHLAATGWQKATAAWAASTNAKIDQMNKHVSANAAQIVTNQKRAQKDLERVQQKWTHAVNTFSKNEKAANSRLSTQFANQDKAARAFAANKISGLIASSAAQFADVNAKMAKNRHEVDMALRQATMRFEASLNAQKALEDKRYAQTVANIAGARAEAKAKVAKATMGFKVGLLSLASEVKQQVMKVNDDIDKTAGVVRSNKAAQAKVNANVNAEMSRMVKLGNKRYKEHLKKDAELAATIAKDNEDTNNELNAMALKFNTALAGIRKQLAKDRAHAEKKLQEETGKVWGALQKQADMRAKKNAKLAADTRRARLDAMDAIRKTKEEFKNKITGLGKVVKANDKKADKQIKNLTGIVNENAIKSAKGRAALRTLEDKNLKELQNSIHEAIKKGEQRAQLVEKRGKKMDKDMQWLANHKLEQEITALRDETNKSVKQLATQNAEARKQLKEEMMYAVNSAAEVAESDLKIAMKDAAEKMTAFGKKADASHAKSAAERKALADSIAANAKAVAQMLADSLDTATAAITAQGVAVAKAIKKTNTRLDAHGAQMLKNAEKARADINALQTKTIKALDAEQKRAAKATADFTEGDKKRQAAARAFLKSEMDKAKKASDAKFGKAFKQMAKDRMDASNNLGGSMENLNKSLAKQAALSDQRFKDTVKDIEKAKKEAAAAVSAFREEFATEVAVTTATVRKVEGKLASELAKVTAEVAAAKEEQANINRKVTADLIRVEDLSNKRHSADARARGALRKIMDENKEAAHEETQALSRKLHAEVDRINKQNAENAREMAKDTTEASQKFGEALQKQADAQAAATAGLNAATAAATAASASSLKNAQAAFDSKIVSLTNTIAANAKTVEKGMEHLTGVVRDIKKANAADRALIRKQTKAMEDTLNASVERAISLGEAKAKAVEQRIASHLKDTKRYLQAELIARAEQAADSVFALLQGKRQQIADNYLSLKAYAVAAGDDIEDYVKNGKGRGLSSVGDLLQLISGVAAINGLVNEYTNQVNQVRGRWPMGLGKYLLDKLEVSMQGKGVLQVDKVEGKNGNFVYMNG